MPDGVLLLKLGLAPLLILLATYAGNRWGNAVSGWIVGLPLTSAPVILILALEQGAGFAVSSAQGSLLGLASLSAFCFTYSLLSFRFGVGLAPSMAAGWLVFFAGSLMLQGVSAPIPASFAGVVLWLLAVSRLLPKPGSEGVGGGSGWGDVAIRVVAAVSLVYAVTEYAPLLGPRLSGLLTPFPIYTSVLAASIHARSGPAASARFVRGATVSLFTPATFWLVVGSTIEAWGVGYSYLAAIAVSLVVHAIILRKISG